MLRVQRLACTSTRRVPHVSETKRPSRAALGVFCKGNWCLSTATRPLLQVLHGWAGTAFHFASVSQISFKIKAFFWRPLKKLTMNSYPSIAYLEEPDLCPGTVVKGLHETKTSNQSRQASPVQKCPRNDWQKLIIQAGQKGRIDFDTVTPTLWVRKPT